MREDRSLFWELLEPEYHGALMFCRKLMANREQGDDLFQDALVLALTKFESLRDQTSFRPWLYRILVNTFHSTVRRPWWKRVVPLTSEMQGNLAGADPVGAHDARRWLNRAFKVLSPEAQALVTLYELEEWTVGELAGLFDLTEGSVKARLFRARRKMKKALLSYETKEEQS